MKLPQSEQTLVTLANASELVNNIAQGILGNEVADTFAGSPLSRTVIYNLAQTKFQATLAKHMGAN